MVWYESEPRLLGIEIEVLDPYRESESDLIRYPDHTVRESFISVPFQGSSFPFPVD